MAFERKRIAPLGEVIWKSTRGPATDTESFDYWMDTEINTMTDAVETLDFDVDANQSTFSSSSLAGAGAFYNRTLTGDFFYFKYLGNASSFSVKDLS